MKRKPFEPVVKYCVYLFHAETLERKEVSAAGRDFMTKGEADRLIKQTGSKMAPWFYAKEEVK